MADGHTPISIESSGLKDGRVIVVFVWSTKHGECVDCGLPAAFIRREDPRLGRDRDKLCSVCAANAAADGEFIERLFRDA